MGEGFSNHHPPPVSASECVEDHQSCTMSAYNTSKKNIIDIYEFSNTTSLVTTPITNLLDHNFLWTML